MRKSDLRVLILEDDSSLGPALKEGLTRAGYKTVWVSNPDAALQQMKRHEIHLALVDCMLPKSNGVEFIESLRNSFPPLKVILTSGVFKDRTFIKDSLRRTGAIAYLSKPFPLDDLIQTVERAFVGELEDDLPPLKETLFSTETNHQKISELLSHELSLHAFDLCFLLPLIMKSELSGELHLTFNTGEPSVLKFHQGQLAQIISQDQRSFFGVLLVEMGFTSSEEIEAIMNLESSQALPIGERLVKAQSISPHAIRVVREEQLVLRLSQTLQDTHVQLSWRDIAPPDSEDNVPWHKVQSLIWDWLNSKVSRSWLEELFSAWGEYTLSPPQVDRMIKNLKFLPQIQPFVELAQRLGSPKPVHELLSEAEDYLETLRMLAFLLSSKLIAFGPKATSNSDFDRQIDRFKLLLKEAEGKDHFELLGLTRRARDSEIQKAYTDLAKIHHPDLLPMHAPTALLELVNAYFARLTMAHDILKDRHRRQTYLFELERGTTEQIMETEAALEKGTKLIKLGRYKEALMVLRPLTQQKVARGDTNIMVTWALLKSPSDKQVGPELLRSAAELMQQVPPEDRHSAHYFFVKGLYYSRVGEFEKSKTNFKHALAIDPSMAEARRELARVRSWLAKQNSTFTGDLASTVVGFFLGKKGQSRR